MAEFGSCKCHGGHGINVPADSLDGICGTCRGRSPEACARVHEREARAVPVKIGSDKEGRAPYYSDESVTLWLGDCLEVLAAMEADSVDAVVTDPPYDLTSGKKGGTGAASLNEAHPAGRSRIGTGGGFMGQPWDATGVAFNPDTWRAVMRVMKPGAYLLAFGGSRTWHRMVCAIEDAGFEIRDPIADLTGMDAPGLLWIQGQGYPKNLDVSKAVDKLKRRDFVLAAIELGLEIPGNNLHDWTKAEHSPGDEWWERFKAHIDPGDWQRIERAVIGRAKGKGTRAAIGPVGIKPEDYDLTAPATVDAAQWEGWGTALKPAWEPVAVARKPFPGTVAQNVLAYGTGALNLAACKVGSDPRVNNAGGASSLQRVSRVEQGYRPGVTTSSNEDTEVDGRWPPNLVLGEAAAAELDRQSGVITSGANPARRGSDKFRDAYGEFAGQEECTVRRGADSGGASRFFPVFRYEPKAPTHERPRLDDGTAWATVKPLDFVRWLCRLATRPGGTILDPFAGTFTTAEACIVEGFRCIAIDKEEAALRLGMERLSKPIQPVMFGMGSAS